MAMTAVITLKYYYAITDLEVGTGECLHHRAHALVAQVTGAIVKLEIVRCPDTGTLQANRCDFCFDNGVTRPDHGIRSLYQFKAPRLRNSQYCVGRCCHGEINTPFL